MTQAVSRITSERVDDLPVIVHWLLQMNLPTLIDQHLPQPHGNRQGLSYGQLSVLLLAYILSQADHRLCAVEPWVRQHHKTLEWTTGWQIGSKDASDDRLADLVEVIGAFGESREQIETGLGQQLIRAYELPTTVARCDTSSFSVYHHLQEQEQDGSLLPYGHSKDRRPDLRQYRQLLGTLDPAGIPLVSSTLAGNGADDPLYVPTWHNLPRRCKRFACYRGRGRPSAKDTTRQITEQQFTLQFQPQEFAISQAEAFVGWRIYVTHAPVERLALPTAVAYYREQWQLERGFHRFKRGNLPALPIYLQNEQRIIGLMFLLTIALRVFTLMEFVVQPQLQEQPQGLRGLYDGNPKRTTHRPTAERLLAALCNITLYHYRDSTFEITPLDDLQKNILSLMAVPQSVYNLTTISSPLKN
jgi:transposase